MQKEYLVLQKKLKNMDPHTLRRMDVKLQNNSCVNRPEALGEALRALYLSYDSTEACYVADQILEVFTGQTMAELYDEVNVETQIGKILRLAKTYHWTADDLYLEADTVREYGEWEHMRLMGYSAEILSRAAEALAESEVG